MEILLLIIVPLLAYTAFGLTRVYIWHPIYKEYLLWRLYKKRQNASSRLSTSSNE